MGNSTGKVATALILIAALGFGALPLSLGVARGSEIPPGAIKIQGEEAVAGNIGSDPNGQEGAYAWTDHHRARSSITYRIVVETAGFYTFAFRYSAGSVGQPRDRLLTVDLNGEQNVAAITFPDTGAWDKWNTVFRTLPLSAGSNMLTLRTEGTGNGICLDYFYLWKAAGEPVLTSIRFTSPTILVEPGKKTSATVEALYSDGSTAALSREVRFVSSDEQVAFVDPGGTIIGIAEGSATITALYRQYTATVTVRVEVPVLTVDLAHTYRPVTHVASGMLYGLADEGRPADEMIAAIKPKNFTQMAPNGIHLPNEESTPTGDALKVAPIAARHGATVTIRMPDIYPTFPYRWVSWDDWYAKVTSMVKATLNSGATNIYAYEIWNEPDWTWNTAKAGPFTVGWKRTYDLIRALDPNTRIMGPSISQYNENFLRIFLTYCRDNKCLPDIISWHELGGPEGPSTPYIKEHIARYRQLEQQLGIPPLPISINEYGAQIEEGVPGYMVQYFAQFERGGVDTANAAFWFRPGRLSNLITDSGEKNGGWWLYKWYGDMTGMMAMTTPPSRGMTLGLDGIASIDPDGQMARVLFGGTDGEAVIRVKGLLAYPFFGEKVKVRVEATPWYGVDTAVDEPYLLFEGAFDVINGEIRVRLRGLKRSWGYGMTITSFDGMMREPDPIPMRYEAEDGVVNHAVVWQSVFASEGRYVGNIDFSDSYVEFSAVRVDTDGLYQLEIGYANGTASPSTHVVAINGKSSVTVTYPSTRGWINAVPNMGDRKTVTVVVQLKAGDNTIRFAKGKGFAELDYIRVVGSALSFPDE